MLWTFRAATEDAHHRSLSSNATAVSLPSDGALLTASEVLGSSTASPAAFGTGAAENESSAAAAGGDHPINSTMAIAHAAAVLSGLVPQYLPQSLAERTYIYGALLGGVIIVSCLRTLLFYQVCCRASKKMHNLMFTAVVHTTMWFFDTNPVGRVMNRFSKDVDMVDAQLPSKLYEFFTFSLLIVGSVILASYSNPWVLLPLAPVLVALLFVRRYYIHSSRALKRLEGIARSPMMSHLSSTLDGLHTVRAYSVQCWLARDFDKHQDGHTEAYYLSLCVGRWLGIRLDWMCVFFVASVTFLCVAAKDNLGLGADLFGLAITYVIALMGLFQWVVRLSIEIESQMTSVERLVEYMQLPSESSPHREPLPHKATAELLVLPAGWPHAGSLVAENLCLRYAADEPVVLSNVSFSIRGAEKVGICGRTGAGKSSLLSALFRLCEPSGRLLIDGVCVSDIGLHDLRSKLSIIPQDPVLFHTTVRRNLDPFARHSDADLWDALQQVQLAAFVQDLPGGLDAAIAEGGANFSVGQRQLLCLARAVIHRNRILVVDEATANVDRMTDAAIQETIKDKFRDCTVLTIAHRLDTIMDSDRVMVLEAGCLHEFDTPYSLLQRNDSLFYSLAQHTGIDYNHLVAIAKAHEMHSLVKDSCQSQSTGDGNKCNT